MTDGYKEGGVDDTDPMQLLVLPEKEKLEAMNKPWDRFFLLGEEKGFPC